MTVNSTQPPTLFIENTSGNPGVGLPVKINDIGYPNNNKNASISLKELIGKAISSIESNGSRININPPLRVTKETRLRFRYLMGCPSYKFSDETPKDLDNSLLTHSE
ncbi:hypothetical protein HOO68_06500 [Candidatus Gracilibacteria bacterium]|nr:hypothetical protein [Candidatus Gracilibacteria bacterium]